MQNQTVSEHIVFAKLKVHLCYCLVGYWIEVANPGKFEKIFYEKSRQKVNEFNNIKKEVDEFIKDINFEYKSIKKEINDFF